VGSETSRLTATQDSLVTVKLSMSVEDALMDPVGGHPLDTPVDENGDRNEWVDPVQDPGSIQVDLREYGLQPVGFTLHWGCVDPTIHTKSCIRCKKVHLSQVECGTRSCGGCGRQRSRKFAKRWEGALLGADKWIFMTLTIPNVWEVNPKEVKILRDFWTTLRRRDSMAWAHGGWYAIEATPGLQLGRNLHMHHLVWAEHAPDFEAIRSDWEDIAGGRWIHVSDVLSPDRAARYLSKEISKGLRPWDRSGIGKEWDSLVGVRLLQRWGDLPSPPEDPDPAECDCGGKLYLGVERDLVVDPYWIPDPG